MKKILSKTLVPDQDIEKLIGYLLRYGVVTASLIVLTGGIIYLFQYQHSAIPQYHVFIGEKAGYTTLTQIFGGVESLNAKGIIQFGVLVLIATPILRIFFSLVGFVFERDKLYILITLIVLSVMMFSIFGGLKV
ncbi:DUF1634 domain-containing protein [Mucilaginibacter aquaedulcis]|uniref:DUF1634 domain-containing protein n=1 Tax=Mucilaginibacter aquaedulcis TaxID=1187081 RepID=UPI0025B5FB4C|nr:DUF1634 domain-containing protein [Mucilaginibacter aquaedulcis]MDN3551762.1 DUF1634 domain-containing protein [Mucilaginibacter aquaedulcis]